MFAAWVKYVLMLLVAFAAASAFFLWWLDLPITPRNLLLVSAGAVLTGLVGDLFDRRSSLRRSIRRFAIQNAKAP